MASLGEGLRKREPLARPATRGTGWRAGRTATRRSKRPVALDDTVVASLREQRKRQREERRQAGPLWLGHEHSAAPDAFVFTTSLGTPLDESNVRRSYQRLLKKAGLPHRRRHDYADVRVMPTSRLRAA